MTRTATEQIIKSLTLRQASGKSCVCCGRDHLPLGRSGRVHVGHVGVGSEGLRVPHLPRCRPPEHASPAVVSSGSASIHRRHAARQRYAGCAREDRPRRVRTGGTPTRPSVDLLQPQQRTSMGRDRSSNPAAGRLAPEPRRRGRPQQPRNGSARDSTRPHPTQCAVGQRPVTGGRARKGPQAALFACHRAAAGRRRRSGIGRASDSSFPGPRKAVRHKGFLHRRSSAEQAWHRVHGPGQRGRTGSGREHDEDAEGDRHGSGPTTNRRTVSRPALLTGSPLSLTAVAPGSYELATEWAMHVRLALAAEAPGLGARRSTVWGSGGVDVALEVGVEQFVEG